MNYISKNVMRLGFTIVLLFVSFSTFAQNQVQEFEPLDVKKVLADIDTIKMEMDSTFYYAKETFMLLKDGVRILGLKKTIQISWGVFLPIVIFLCLFFLWRIKRK